MMLDDSQPVIAAMRTRELSERLCVPDAPTAEATERLQMIAHDLRTPLSIITLEAQMIGARVPTVHLPAIAPGLERIVQNAAYIDRLLGDMLDFASLEASMFQIRIERVDLADVLHDTIERAVSTLERDRVQLAVEQGAIVRGDRHRIERVVANLLSNALKYSTSTVTVALEVFDNVARVVVADRGRGLTPEQASTVFDRFCRTRDARASDGYGLGLYISRKIIDAHGGRIGVTSTLGAGSQFYFELFTIR